MKLTQGDIAYTGQLHFLRQGHGGDATCRDPEQQQQRYETPPQLHRVGSARFRENGATDLLGTHPVSVVGQGKRNDRKIGRKREGAEENRVQWTLWTHGLRGSGAATVMKASIWVCVCACLTASNGENFHDRFRKTPSHTDHFSSLLYSFLYLIELLSIMDY